MVDVKGSAIRSVDGDRLYFNTFRAGIKDMKRIQFGLYVGHRY